MKNFTISKEEAEVLLMGLDEALFLAKQAEWTNPINKPEIELEEGFSDEWVINTCIELELRLRLLLLPEKPRKIIKCNGKRTTEK